MRDALAMSDVDDSTEWSPNRKLRRLHFDSESWIRSVAVCELCPGFGESARLRKGAILACADQSSAVVSLIRTQASSPNVMAKLTFDTQMALSPGDRLGPGKTVAPIGKRRH